MDQPIRVLLIEDNPADARLIEFMLSEARGLRFKLDWAASLTAGVDHLRAHPIDVVLLDLGLPEGTGLDTLQRLFALAAPMRRVPTIVVLSGITDEEIAVQALQAGAQDYLVKGQVESALLVRAIRYAIGRTQAEDALRQAHAEAQAAKAIAEQASRAKSSFLASMSHDLRTPLNGILGFAQILEWDRTLSDRQQVGVSAIRQSGEHLLTLINDILDVAKIEAGKLEINATDFDLAKFVKVVEDIIRVKARQKPDLALVCDLADDLPGSVHADERRLRQVLLNLLDNAVKFTERGEVTFRVRFTPPARLRFEVQDTGKPLTDEQRSRLFKPFEQVGDAHQRGSGTGLGLVISRQFVRLMGGDIEVSSVLGQGNLFEFGIDAPAVESRAAPDAARDDASAGYRGRRRRVLVVDDVPENRAVLVCALEGLRFDVAQATNGIDALAAANAAPPDMILMDIVMPGQSGIETIRQLRQVPAFARTPVIAISASAAPEAQAEALAAGADVFLAKPVHLQGLVQHLGSLLHLTWIEDDAGAPGRAEHEPSESTATSSSRFLN